MKTQTSTRTQRCTCCQPRRPGTTATSRHLRSRRHGQFTRPCPSPGASMSVSPCRTLGARPSGQQGAGRAKVAGWWAAPTLTTSKWVFWSLTDTGAPCWKACPLGKEGVTIANWECCKQAKDNATTPRCGSQPHHTSFPVVPREINPEISCCFSSSFLH